MRREASKITATIRPALDTDGGPIGQLIRSVFAEYPGCPFCPDEFPELIAPATHYHERKGQFFVALDYQDRIIGCFAICPRDRQGWFELLKVYVAREARGQAIAQALFTRSVAWAEQTGSLKGLALWTDTRFTRGHRFYEKLGFERMPVIRFLNDAAQSLEFHYSKRI